MAVLLKMDRVKRIPTRHRIPWIVITLLCLLLFVGLFSTPQKILDGAREYTVTVEEARLESTISGRTHRTTLVLTTNEGTFSLLYPRNMGRTDRDAIWEDLVSGRVTTVTVLASSEGIFLRNLWRRQQILDLRSGGTVYYNLETAVGRLRIDYTFAIVFFVLFALFWLIDTLFLALGYSILIFRNGKPKKK